jgi:capsular polysaccharide biosynthesis protein
MLLFFAVSPKLIILLAFTIGVITGVCITSLILYLANTIRSQRMGNK